jgi:glycosyltransferase involved in cell wall biosynthesis
MSISKRILFDAERMKYANTGLFHFCKQLTHALAAQINPQKEVLEIFTNKESFPLFKTNSFRKLQFWHTIVLPSIQNVNVWHATHQDTRFFPFRRNIPIVLTIHDINYFHDPNKSWKKKQAFLKVLQRKIDASSYLVFISAYTHRDVEKHFKIDHKPFRIIYNGCNIPPDLPHQSKLKLPSQPYLFTIGTITDKKNFHVLPSLLVNSNYQLLIAGITQSDNYLQKIKNEAEKLGVLDQLEFVGPVNDEEKSEYYQHCEAFVFPSLAEGFGLPVIEAMHFGKPVFLSTYTSLPEIGGDVAYYFDSFEQEGMRQTLKAGLEDYQKNKPQEKIRERSQLFSWETAAKEYLEVYKSLYID